MMWEMYAGEGAWAEVVVAVCYVGKMLAWFGEEGQRIRSQGDIGRVPRS